MQVDYWNDPMVRAWDRRQNIDAWIDNVKRQLYTKNLAHTHYLVMTLDAQNNVHIVGKGIKRTMPIIMLKSYLCALIPSRMELLSPVITDAKVSVEFRFSRSRGEWVYQGKGRRR